MLQVEDAVDVVCEEFVKKKIGLLGVDYEELGLYLSLNLEPEVLARKGIDTVCPTRAHNRRRPEITASGVSVKKEDRFRPWIAAQTQPNQTQKDNMMKEAIRCALLVVMKNHTYEFNGEVRKQAEGGPIGMDLTGTVAKIFMRWWDERLASKLGDMGIQPMLYERYVDDIDSGMEATAEGATYTNGGLQVTEEKKKEDEGVPADKRTFDFVKEVGNSIHQSIQLETDVPSNYEDNKLPILDLKVWMGEVETEDGIKRKIMHEHYIKDIANKYVIERDSAMSLQSKRRILTQMCLRVMLNNSKYLSQEEKREKVNFFMRRMQASGYEKKFRYEVLRSAINAYEKMDGDMDRPLYRGKEMNTAQRRKERKKEKNAWFKRGGCESVLFVQATPKSELKQMIQEELAASNINIKVIERSGRNVKRILQKNNPFAREQCVDNSCFVCTTTKEGDCRKSGVTYEIQCKGDCDGHRYGGETHANGFTRGGEHQKQYGLKNPESTMWKHCVKEHNGQEQEFEMRIVDYSRGDPLMRQIKEAININEIPIEKRLNDKKEWNIGKLPTMEITDG